MLVIEQEGRGKCIDGFELPFAPTFQALQKRHFDKSRHGRSLRWDEDTTVGLLLLAVLLFTPLIGVMVYGVTAVSMKTPDIRNVQGRLTQTQKLQVKVMAYIF